MAKKITYRSGKFSLFKLEIGGRFWLEALPDKVRIWQMFWGVIPRKVIWEFEFPFYIRTAIEAWDTSKEKIDLVLDLITNCQTDDDLLNKLQDLNAALQDYVEKNEQRAMRIAFNKVGWAAFRKIRK